MDILNALMRIFRAALSRLGTVRKGAIPVRSEDVLSIEQADTVPDKEAHQIYPVVAAAAASASETNHDSPVQASISAVFGSHEKSDQNKNEDAPASSTLDTVQCGAPPSPISADDTAPPPPDSIVAAAAETVEDKFARAPELIEHPGSPPPADVNEPDQLRQPPLGSSEARTDSDAQSVGGAVEIESQARNDNKPRKPRLNPEPGPRSAPQPRTQISHEPFVEQVSYALPSEYALWNTAITQHCLFAGGSEAEDVYITVTPRTLAAAFTNAGGEALTPETAQLRFAEAVSTMYRERVLAHPRRLRILRREGPDNAPECMAFLALSVLAAYEMHSDDESSAAAYYVRLADLLRSDLVGGGRPRGFDLEEFEALWHFVRAWLRDNRRRNLAMPGVEAGFRRFVALPLAHVPLRKVDIERLPEFFAWSAYEPFSKVPRDRLDADLAKWSQGRAVFTNAGTAALGDERRNAVVAQIAHELECWDGSHTDPQGRRSTIVEIFLEPVRRRPELFYLPRRPAAFPNVFDDGVHTFDSEEGGWYSPLPIDPADGDDLHAGFSWEAATGGLRLAMRRPEASVVALAPSEFSGFISHRGLPLGTMTAVLCHSDAIQPTTEYLTRITGQRCQPTDYTGMPSGWRLFTGIRPTQESSVPEGLDDLVVERDIELVPTGGLRLGRRWAWLNGAPPKLILTGDPNVQAMIDGEPVEIGADGAIKDGGRLTRPGVRIIEAGRLRRRIEIVDAEVAALPAPGLNGVSHSRQTTIALPHGLWFVVGASPTESTMVDSGQWGGSVLNCPFNAVWAISVGSGPGAAALCLVDAPPLPEIYHLAYGKRARRCAEAWASSIYNAAIRRPRLSAAYGAVAIPHLAEIWASYVERAQQVKRALRARRR